MAPVPGKSVRDAFFRRQTESSNVWICKCGTTRKLRGTSYSNVVSHVRSDHPKEYQVLVDEFSARSTAENNCTKPKSSTVTDDANTFLYRRKSTQIFGWIEFVVDGLQPFSVVENPTFRKHSRLDPITRTTLAKYLEALTSSVEDKITQLLPDKFAIVFDGWSCGDTHYVAMYATFPYNAPVGYRKVLLGFSPFQEETSQRAQQHYEYMEFVLSTFKKSFDNVAVLIGDNCNTNKALADKAGTLFVGCASHRFNLAMKDKLREYQDLIERVHELMKKLKNPIAAAQLRKHTDLRAKSNNATRWSSTYEMFHRYTQIHSVLVDVDIADIENFLLSPRADKKVHDLFKQLGDLNSVTKCLQSEGVTLSEVRTFFDEVIHDHPDLTDRLSATADIVKDPVFEMAICKLRDGKQLEQFETLSLKSFEVEQREASSSERDEVLSLAARALKRRKLQQRTSACYVDSRFVVPTSNMCERLFSVAGYALNGRRKRILPMNFEVQIFLHENREMWNISDVDRIAKSK